MSSPLPEQSRNTRVRCVLFDLDGTLVDTAPDLGAAANHVREHLGLAPLPLIDYRPVASAGARGLLQKALGIDPAHPDYEALRKRFLDHYRAHIADHSEPFAGIVELLEHLESAGQPWGVVTNKPGWLTRPLMDQLGLSSRAACCVSGDDVARPKPAPDSLQLACAEMRVDPSLCVYLGDDRRDINAGLAAGMLTAVAQWGYLGENETGTDWNAQALLATPTALIDWLNR